MASLSNTVWIFNERIRAFGMSVSIPFESCGETWTQISASGYTSDIEYIGQGGSVVAYDFSVGLGSWTNDAYRTIKIGTTSLTDDSDFGAWLKANARKTASKVVYGDTTIIDITDTTATEDDVAEGVVFYKADGTRSVGIMQAGGFSPTLLWTNSNPSAAFSAQKISVDLSGYEWVLIDFRTTRTAEYRAFQIFEVGSSGRLQAIQSGMSRRAVEISSTGVDVGSGSNLTASGSSFAASDNVCVPYKIYGL